MQGLRANIVLTDNFEQVFPYKPGFGMGGPRDGAGSCAGLGGLCWAVAGGLTCLALKRKCGFPKIGDPNVAP